MLPLARVHFGYRFFEPQPVELLQTLTNFWLVGAFIFSIFKARGPFLLFVGQLSGWLAGWLPGWLIGWLAGWLAGWLVGWLVVWLAGSLGRTSGRISSSQGQIFRPFCLPGTTRTGFCTSLFSGKFGTCFARTPGRVGNPIPPKILR